MSYFECFSVPISTIICFNPKFSLLFFCAKLDILLYINKNGKRCARLSRSSYYRFSFLCLAFGHPDALYARERNLCQNKKTKPIFEPGHSHGNAHLVHVHSYENEVNLFMNENSFPYESISKRD